MKIIALLAGLLIGFPSVAQNQKIFACQYTHSEGFKYAEKNWTSTRFSFGKPFFLKINPDGLIDKNSLQDVLLGVPECKTVYKSIKPEVTMCLGFGEFIVFNSNTMEGSISYMVGVTQDGNRRDTMTMSIFNCQRM
jgi:hypothetical protein